MRLCLQKRKSKTLVFIAALFPTNLTNRLDRAQSNDTTTITQGHMLPLKLSQPYLNQFCSVFVSQQLSRSMDPHELAPPPV